MQPMSLLETRLNDSRANVKLHTLIIDLRWRVHLLDSDIHDEEKRTGVFDVSDIAYPVLARNLRGRRHNLLATIAMLRSQLVEAVEIA
jgi:hypothetical protein